MTTKIMIIVGVSVASVLALFVMGYFLDKKPRNDEQATASTDGKSQSDESSRRHVSKRSALGGAAVRRCRALGSDLERGQVRRRR